MKIREELGGERSSVSEREKEKKGTGLSLTEKGQGMPDR